MHKYFIRTGSFVIDMSIINMFAQTLYKYIFGFYIHLSFNNLAHDIAVILFYLILMILIALAYQAICYRYIKNSLGKQLMQLQYYNLDGTNVTFKTLMKREFIKYYLIYATVLTYIPYSFFRMVMRNPKPTYHEKQTSTYVASKIVYVKDQKAPTITKKVSKKKPKNRLKKR